MSLAKCNICSRYDRNINVICEKRCLICARCQGNPVIKKLFVDAVTNHGIDGILCPLCNTAMSRTMVRRCQEHEVPPTTPAQVIHASGNSRVTNDLYTHKNPLISFLKRFAKTYGELGGVSDTYLRPALSRGGTAGGSRPVSTSIGGADELAFGADAFKSGAFAQGTGTIGKNSPPGSPSGKMGTSTSTGVGVGVGTGTGTGTGAGMDAPATPQAQLAAPSGPTFIDPEKVLPYKFSKDTMLEVACEAFCLQWQSILKNGNEGMGTMLIKSCTRKKMSSRTNEYKVKSVLDFFHAGGPSLDNTPTLVLLGKICGALPRSRNSGYPDFVRKAWGPIATSVLVIANCERCWKQGVLKDADDNPSAAEVRTKLNKCLHNKVMSLKRAIRLLSILMDSDQAHWSMTPYLPAVNEYNCRIPWHSESISRLLHFLFQVSKPHGWEAEKEKKEKNAHESNRHAGRNAGPVSAKDLAAEKAGTPKPITSNDILRDLRTKSRKLWAAKQRPVERRGVGKGSMNHNLHIGKTTNANLSSKKETGATLVDTVDSRNQSPLHFEERHGSSVDEDTGNSGNSNHSRDDTRPSTAESKSRDAYEYGLQNASFASIDAGVDRNVLFTNNLDTQSVTSISAASISGNTATTESTAGVAGGYVKHPVFVPMHSVFQAEADANFIPPPRMGAIDDGEYDECDYASAISQAENRQITVADLALVCCEAWENECALMQHTLNRALVGTDRRMAIAGAFDISTTTGNLREKRAMLRILKWYASVFCREVDWAEVRQMITNRDFPFDVPMTLLEKSTAELHSLAIVVASDWEFAQARDFAEDMAAKAGMSVEDYAARVVNAMHIPRMKGTTGGIDRLEIGKPISRSGTATRTIRINEGEDDNISLADDVSALYLGEDYQDSADVSLTSEFNNLGATVNRMRNTAQASLPLTADEAAAWRNYRSPVLAPLAYASNQPVRHPLNMVDVLDNDPALLKKLRILSNGPVGPNTRNTNMRTIDDDILSIMNKQMKPDDDTATAADDSTHDSNHFDDMDPEFDDTASYKRAGGEVSSEEDDLMEVEEIAVLEKVKAKSGRLNNVAMQAKGRVLTAIQIAQNKVREKDMNKRQGRIRQYEETKRQIEEEKSRQVKLEYTDLSHIDAAVVSAPVGLASALAFEKAVKSLEYRDKQVAPGVVSYIANGYLRPWQLEVLLNLDLNNANIMTEGGAIIASHLSKCCRLTHLNLNGNNVGDNSCGKLLQAVVRGGGVTMLRFLDLRRNQLTMVTDGLSHLGGLVHLESINLAWNCITLDNTRHSNIFIAALKPLCKATYLNLAHNRLQDRGVSILQEDILPGLSNLAQLDLSYSFITPASFNNIEAALRRTDTKLKLLRLKGNIFKDTQRHELRYIARMTDATLFMDSEFKPFDKFDSSSNTLNMAHKLMH